MEQLGGWEEGRERERERAGLLARLIFWLKRRAKSVSVSRLSRDIKVDADDYVICNVYGIQRELPRSSCPEIDAIFSQERAELGLCSIYLLHPIAFKVSGVSYLVSRIFSIFLVFLRLSRFLTIARALPILVPRSPQSVAWSFFFFVCTLRAFAC